jgi:hypothetical protein
MPRLPPSVPFTLPTLPPALNQVHLVALHSYGRPPSCLGVSLAGEMSAAAQVGGTFATEELYHAQKKFESVSCRHLSCAQCQILDMRDVPMLTTTSNASTSTVGATSATFCAQWDGLDDNYMPGECHATHSPCCFVWSHKCPAHVSPLHHREAHNYQNTLTLHTSNAVLTSSPCTASAECLQHNTIHTTVVETVVDWLRPILLEHTTHGQVAATLTPHSRTFAFFCYLFLCLFVCSGPRGVRSAGDCNPRHNVGGGRQASRHRGRVRCCRASVCTYTDPSGSQRIGVHVSRHW